MSNVTTNTARATSTGQVRGIVVPDLHFTLTPPGSRTKGYAQELGSFISQVEGLVTSTKAQWVGSLGDIFHRKGQTSHEEVTWAMEALGPLVDQVGAVLAIAGNHDMVAGGSEQSRSSQPIGVLEHAGYVHRVDFVPTFVRDKDEILCVCGVSYEQGFSPLAMAVGLAKRIAYEHARLLIPAPTAFMIFLHHDIVHDDPRAKQFMDTLAAQLDTMIPWTAPRPYLAMVGHLHTTRGGTSWADKRGNNHAFVSCGTLARTSLAESSVVPAAFAVSFSGGKCKVSAIPLACHLAKDAFRDGGSPNPLAPQSVVKLDDFLSMLKTEDGGAKSYDHAAAVDEVAAKLGHSPQAASEAKRILSESI